MFLVIASHVHHEPDAIFLVMDRADRLELTPTMDFRIRLSKQVVNGERHTFLTYALDPYTFLQVSGFGPIIVGDSLDDPQGSEYLSWLEFVSH